MYDLGILQWLILGLGALLVGFAKTSVGAVVAVSVALFAGVLPAKESTGTLLPLLLVGDLVAVRAYHAHADWRRLLALLPAVLFGLLAGVIFLDKFDDSTIRRAIGLLLILLVGVSLIRRRARMGGTKSDGRAQAGVTSAYGSLAGFTTMVANAGGAVTALYLLRSRLPKLQYLGTTAWFFLAVNLIKVPFSVSLGLIRETSLTFDVVVLPLVLLGALLGRILITRVDQDKFESLILLATVASSLWLLR